MAAGPLIAAAAQSTTTTTGTGTLTIANTVPAGAPAGSTTFAAVFAPTAVYPVANIFYALIDASSNIEAGYGTLTSATTFTRDFVIFAGTANNVAPYVPALLSTPTGSFINLAAGTANLYSNPGLLSQVTPYQQRFPNFTGNASSSAQDGGITEDIMSGSFSGTLNAGTATAVMTIKYKVSSNGEVQLFLPATAAVAAGTTLTITGIPSYLSNVTTVAFPMLVVGGTGGQSVPGLGSLAGGASPTSTGTITISQLASGVYSPTFTTAVSNGVSASVVTYSLY